MSLGGRHWVNGPVMAENLKTLKRYPLVIISG
jgi:hypothetical protein